MARRRTFDCGHRGKGQYCHRCRQEEDRRAARAREKQAWRSRLEAASIPVHHLPRHVAEKALAILEQLQDGLSYTRLRGKRMKTINQRQIITIPVGYSHRLICEDRPEGLAPLEIVTHETYNSRIAAGGWA